MAGAHRAPAVTGMEHLYSRIFADAEFQALQRRRERLGWLLSALVFGGFFAFILLIAFAPRMLAVPLAADLVTTRGIPFGAGIILFGFALTGVFVRRSNRDFDTAMARILARHADGD